MGNASCCRIRILPTDDSDALVFAPDATVQSDTVRTNWAVGLPATSGLFANNQGDPTAVVAGDYSTILGGVGHSVVSDRSGIVAGGGGSISAAGGFIGGGTGNTVASIFGPDFGESAVLAGTNNTVTGFAGCIIAGIGNDVASVGAVVAGGFGNMITGTGTDFDDTGFIGGGSGNSLLVGVFDTNFSNAIIAGQVNTILDTNRSVVAGGFSHIVRETTGVKNGSNFIGGGSGSLLDNAGSSATVATGSSRVTAPGGGIASLRSGIFAGDDNRIVATLTSVADAAIVAGHGHRVRANDSVAAAGIGSVVTDTESFVCAGGSATVGTPRTFAHGTGPVDAVGFRGAAPVAAPVLAPLPAPTGIAGLDAWLASADVALKGQGLAV